MVYSFLLSFCPIILFYFMKSVQTDLFSAQVEIDNLFVLEKLVLEQINFYLIQEDLRLQELRRRIEYNFPSRNVNNKDNDVKVNVQQKLSDPISNYLVIKRLVVDLDKILSVVGEKKHSEKLIENIQQLKKSYEFPTEEDLAGTIHALTRTQETYNLEAHELANGFLAGLYCGSQLNVDDCFELGKQNYKSNEIAQSINWFNEALKRVNTVEENLSDLKSPIHENPDEWNYLTLPLNNFQTVTTKEILKYLEAAQNINQTVLMAKGFLTESLGIQVDNVMDEFSKLFEAVEGNPQVEEPFRNVKLKYEALCRQEIYNMNGYSGVPPLSELRCYSYYDGYNILLGPIKQEVLSTSPLILLFHDVVSDDEIQILQELAKPKFRTAHVITSSGGSTTSKVRTSKAAWLEDDSSPLIKKLNDRMSSITNLDLKSAEELQIVNYGTGGQYEPHFDFYYGRHSAAIADEAGNRIATLLIYLSDVVAGGATVFPSLNLSVQPKKGTALFWYNLLEDGSGDFRTRHGACPVLIGSKWVANKWIHARCNEGRIETHEEDK